MSIHTADITARLQRFLARRQVPKHLAAQASAMMDETRALAETVERNAPRGPAALAEWWPKFEAALGVSGRGFWPTEKEVADAARVVNSEAAKQRIGSPQAFTLNAAEVAGRMMAEGNAVAEGWLYGRSAVELIGRKLVDLETMTRYRSAAFFARKDAFGEEAALAWEAEAKDRHEAAKAMLKDTVRAERDVVLPNKRDVPQVAA